MTPLALALAAVILAPADYPRWDAAGNVAWLTGTDSGTPADYRGWFNAATIGGTVGYYWSPHLKLEAGVDNASRAAFYTTGRQPVPGSPFPVFTSSRHDVALRTVSAVASYQFLENAWAHPFVSGGAEVAYADDRIETFADPRTTALTRSTTTTLRPTVGGGVKLYVSPRAFVRTDAHWTIDSGGVARFRWRTGIGVDF